MRPLVILMLIVAAAIVLFIPVSFLTNSETNPVLQNYLLSGFIFVEVLLFLVQRLENERDKPALEIILDPPQRISEELVPKGGFEGTRQTITVSSKWGPIKSLMAELSVDDRWIDKLRWERMGASTRPPMLVLRPDGKAPELVRGDLPPRAVVSDIDLIRGETEYLVVWDAWKHRDGSHVLVLNTELKRVLNEKDWSNRTLRLGVRFLSESQLKGKSSRRYLLDLSNWDDLHLVELT